MRFARLSPLLSVLLACGAHDGPGPRRVGERRGGRDDDGATACAHVGPWERPAHPGIAPPIAWTALLASTRSPTTNRRGRTRHRVSITCNGFACGAQMLHGAARCRCRERRIPPRTAAWRHLLVRADARGVRAELRSVTASRSTSRYVRVADHVHRAGPRTRRSRPRNLSVTARALPPFLVSNPRTVSSSGHARGDWRRRYRPLPWRSGALGGGPLPEGALPEVIEQPPRATFSEPVEGDAAFERRRAVFHSPAGAPPPDVEVRADRVRLVFSLGARAPPRWRSSSTARSRRRRSSAQSASPSRRRLWPVEGRRARRRRHLRCMRCSRTSHVPMPAVRHPPGGRARGAGGRLRPRRSGRGWRSRSSTGTARTRWCSRLR